MIFKHSVCSSPISPFFSELGQQLKEEEERLHQLKLEGHEVFQEYVQQGKEAIASKQARNLSCCSLEFTYVLFAVFSSMTLSN